MTPIMLSALGAFVLLLVWSLTLSRVLVARIACVTAMAVSLHLAVSGNLFDRDADLMSPIMLHGVDPSSGDLVHIDVVLKGEGREPRSVRRVPISTEVSGGPWSAALLFGIGLLGLISVRRNDDRMALFALGATTVGALLVLGVALGIPSGGAGTEWVREYLVSTISAERIESFRPPVGGWIYPGWGIPAATLLLVLSVSAWLPRLPAAHVALEPALVVASLCVVGAFAWNAYMLGGFVWGGLDGALCVQAVAAASGMALNASPGTRGLAFSLVAVMAVAGLTG